MDKLELYTKLVQNSKLKRIEPLKGLVLELVDTFTSGFFDSTNFTYKIVNFPSSYFFHTSALISLIESKLESVSKTVSRGIWSAVFIIDGDNKYNSYNGTVMMSENVKKEIKKEFDSIKTLTEKYSGEEIEVSDIKYGIENSTLKIYVYTASDVTEQEDAEFPELDKIYDIFNVRIPDFEMEVYLKKIKQ